MALFRKKAVMPTKEEALPGRSAPLKVPETHFVNGHRIVPPFPAGLRTRVARSERRSVLGRSFVTDHRIRTTCPNFPEAEGN